MNYKLYIYILSVTFFTPHLHCQVKNTHQLIYEQYNTHNFREYNPFHQAIDFNSIDYPLLNAAIFFVTNQVRSNKNLNILEYHPKLEQSAMMHSKDMVELNFFDHFNRKIKEHREPIDRYKLVGIKNPYPAENIAEEFGLQYKAGEKVYIIGKGIFSYKDKGNIIPPHTYISFAESLVDAWMHSPPHKKNILSKDAVQLGCGSCKFINSKFNDMPTFKCTQNFQLYKKIEE